VIFVTVGHQMPFDRLVRVVDDWARLKERDDVFAQIGKTDYRPAHIRFQQFLSPSEFDQRMREATGIVAHAGTGTIIAAAQLGKPLLVMPRLARLEETRNDHQVPTMRRFAERGLVLAASDERELERRLDGLEGFRPRATIGGAASDQLIAALRQFIDGA